MGSKTIIAATTGAVDSGDVRLYNLNGFNTIVASGLQTGENIDIQLKMDTGDYEDIYVDGVQQQITEANNVVTFVASGVYKFVKPITAAAVSLRLVAARTL